MSLSVVVMPRAEADLREIANWWATNRSSEQAGRWLDGILEAIGSLSENPDRRPRAREDRRHRYELRELHFGLGSRATHRVIFTIRPEKVVVLTVRHLAQDDWDAV
ncbi:MAG: type II toxin-antitoxin system RelE/ParE family toxin [Planctomycetota bacterium]|nr:MAG: type II toxin-antitoxin system RelE/ParE family toxin [Planctomycetota bacterium]REJ94433.1 MAG: type II toxin-antitoxin system RelE/ParE family toxin [Planctomycetota bacterium]